MGTISAPSTNNTPFFGGIGNFFNDLGTNLSNNNPTSGSYANPSPIDNPASALPAISYSAPVNYGNQNMQAPATYSPNIAQTPQRSSQPQQTVDPYAALRNQISSGWDSYMNQLNSEFGGLSDQNTAQNNIVNGQYNQGVDAANAQKASSLKDIANTIKNAFQAGNNYLGARGAGDSSAANQYSFAINQEANKQNSNLNDFVNGQVNNLGAQRDQQLNSIANWYAGAQNQLKQQIANGSLGKSQDLQSLSSNILNQGLSMINQVQQQAQSQYNALTQWAANNSGSLQQLQSNIASIPKPVSGVQMDSNGNMQVPVGYGYGNNNDQTQNPTQSGLFSNPAWFQ